MINSVLSTIVLDALHTKKTKQKRMINQKFFPTDSVDLLQNKVQQSLTYYSLHHLKNVMHLVDSTPTTFFDDI